MRLVEEGRPVKLLVEICAYEGVKRIAGTIAEDIRKVTGQKPEIVTEREYGERTDRADRVILCATVGKSALLEELERSGMIDLSAVRGKREVYQIRLQEGSPACAGELLVICGSDKRGTIYGMFALSEYIGVSALCYWGDVTPRRNPDIVVGREIETVSKEPSVMYRGFFINDEWPCFGTWARAHFGGTNAECYERVFELLLRLKGNYMWPAMWADSFPLDGPGSRNEELADEYGIIIGYSHHEPCLRASEEWDKVRGPESPYGNEWNFRTNEEGLLRYWEDALKRSGGYEKMITIGMRGERDTSMLGGQASIKENIELLKDIICKQKRLIRKYAPDAPQILALYKEVEAYFYGDSETEGLKDWPELDGVICMLCEDNFGNMRTLPTPENRERPGGYGMYYHLDYHGAPVSYEWVDSTPLSLIWEQMSTAYEYGIREAWIVNVGDIKFHEVPLSYFMALAWDYEKWGGRNPDSPAEYAKKWAKECFPAADRSVRLQAAKVLTEYMGLNYLRRPESLHAGIYHSCHYEETDRMLKRAEEIERLSAEIEKTLSGTERDAYYSMVHYSAMASMNLLKMHLYAGKNHHYAKQGRPAANRYAALTRECIRRDKELAGEFREFREGKWSGMELASHIGFIKWNEDGWRYPVLHMVEPAGKPRLSVSRKDSETVLVKDYSGSVLLIPDFLDAECGQVILELSNDGTGILNYRIEPADGREMPAWLEVSPKAGEVTELQEVVLTCRRPCLTAETETVRILIRGGDTTIAADISARAVNIEDYPDGTFWPRQGVVTMEARHYCRRTDTERGSFRVIEDYGKYGSGVKVFPVTAEFGLMEEKPSLTYRFFCESTGDYTVEVITSPVNPQAKDKPLRCCLENGKKESRIMVVVPRDYRAGEHSDLRWSRAVLNQEHIAGVRMPFDAGVQELTIGALEAGMVIERIRIYPAKKPLAESYLGPEESVRSGTDRSQFI